MAGSQRDREVEGTRRLFEFPISLYQRECLQEVYLTKYCSSSLPVVLAQTRDIKSSIKFTPSGDDDHLEESSTSCHLDVDNQILVSASSVNVSLYVLAKR